MTTFKWSFPALETYPQHDGESNVVFAVHYQLSGDDGNNHTSSVYGVVDISTKDVSTFIPFNELTPEIITGWVEAALGEAQIAALKSIIESDIEREVDKSTTLLSPPWQQMDTSVVESQ